MEKSSEELLHIAARGPGLRGAASGDISFSPGFILPTRVVTGLVLRNLLKTAAAVQEKSLQERRDAESG